MNANDHLKNIRERAEAATAGPWGVHVEEAGDSVFLAIEPAESFDWIADFSLSQEADAQFIAHARTDLPRLLDALERVLEVHKQDDDMPLFCHACDDYWPCPTVAAINDALEGK